MSVYLSGNFFSKTDKGLVREANEDCVLTAISPYGEILLCVCDGMGGRNKGDYASKFLCNSIHESFNKLTKKISNPNQIEKWLYKAINEANRKIYLKSNSDSAFKGMGSTLSLAYISGDLLVTAQVGDSRVYIIKDNKLVQITQDQSFVQYLENSQEITKSQAKTHPERHKLTNAIGIRKDCNVDFKSYSYNRENILVCSDGVYNNVSDLEIASILKSSGTPEQKCIQLINFGNANGGSDNMAVIVWEAN